MNEFLFGDEKFNLVVVPVGTTVFVKSDVVYVHNRNKLTGDACIECVFYHCKECTLNKACHLNYTQVFKQEKPTVE